MRGTVRNAIPSSVVQSANSRVLAGVCRSTSDVTTANSKEMVLVKKHNPERARCNPLGRTDLGRPVQTIRSPYSESRATVGPQQRYDRTPDKLALQEFQRQRSRRRLMREPARAAVLAVTLECGRELEWTGLQ